VTTQIQKLGTATSRLKTRSSPILMPILLVLLVVGMVLSLAVGPVSVPLHRVIVVLLQPAAAHVDPMEATIIWEMRFGRALLAALIGAGLAVSGAALQGLFRNPLAAPFVVGA
jgi:iron complex transport system permease protein